MFDSIFTDMAQHDRIKESEQQIQAAMRAFKTQIKEQQDRKQSVKEQLANATANLENSRKELQRIRAEAFRNVGANGMPSPAYSS